MPSFAPRSQERKRLGERFDEDVYTRYFNKEHLGSIAVITKESGIVLERFPRTPAALFS